MGEFDLATIKPLGALPAAVAAQPLQAAEARSVGDVEPGTKKETCPRGTDELEGGRDAYRREGGSLQRSIGRAVFN